MRYWMASVTTVFQTVDNRPNLSVAGSVVEIIRSNIDFSESMAIKVFLLTVLNILIE